MEVLRAFGTFVVDLATSVDNLSPAIKKELYPFVALILTILFVRAHYISHYRLAWKSQRKAALNDEVAKAEIQQVRFLIVGPVVLLVFLTFSYFYVYSGPAAVGFFTAPQVLAEKSNNTLICERAMREGNLLVAEKAVRNKSVGAALFRAYKDAHPSLSSWVSSLANFCIIYTGAMFSILPFLVLMVAHTVLYPFRNFVDGTIWGLSTRFFDVVIPVVNIVTATSLLVFFVFHLLVDNWRAENCLWTSGHWYTYVITTLCFFFVLTHLILNEPEKYATPYVAWFALQQFLSFSALRETQMFFHSMAEALDGVRYALLLFPLLALLGGYIARRQCQPPSVSPIEAAKKVAEPQQGTLAKSAFTVSMPTVTSEDASSEAKVVAEPGEDYVHVSSPAHDAPSDAPAAPPDAPDGPPDAPDGPPDAPPDAPLPPSPKANVIVEKPQKPNPKPPGGPSESRLDASDLQEQIRKQREKMKTTTKTSPDRPLEGLALQLRNIRAMVNPDIGLEQEANEEDWEV